MVGVTFRWRSNGWAGATKSAVSRQLPGRLLRDLFNWPVVSRRTPQFVRYSYASRVEYQFPVPARALRTGR